LARWRETGALLGVCLAAVLPTLLITVTDLPFTGFAIAFALLALVSWNLMQGEWEAIPVSKSLGLREVLKDRIARRLLIVAFVNAAPVAVSSTLFLFFVEARLMAQGMEGIVLLLFFLAAACSAPIWSGLAQHHGPKRTLMGAMVLAIFAFAFTSFLGAGDWLAFAVVCLVSGAALGADLTLLPAMFSKRMAQISPSALEGFGLWSFVSKFTLAFAAVVLLPALQWAGFENGSHTNTSDALVALTFFYALVPCILKAVALILLTMTEVEEINP